MTMEQYYALRDKVEIGDIIRVDKYSYHLTHDKWGSRLAEVIGKYSHHFVIRHFDGGYTQSIRYTDVNAQQKIVSKNQVA